MYVTFEMLDVELIKNISRNLNLGVRKTNIAKWYDLQFSGKGDRSEMDHVLEFHRLYKNPEYITINLIKSRFIAS